MVLSPKVAEVTGWLWLFTPIAALAVHVVAQILLFRASKGGQFLRTMVGGFLCGFVVLALLDAIRIALQGVSVDAIADAVLVDAPIYAALSYCYLNFAQLGQTSVRIRLYVEIGNSPDGLGAEEISEMYNDQALMRTRLRRLLESGDIVERDGRYYVGRSKLVQVANLIFACKRLLLNKESEFDLQSTKRVHE
jgi:hypothetical protein